MKQDITINLMMVNKIIIFFENMINEEVDFEFFTDKIIFDINFIDTSLNKLFDRFIKEVSYYSNDNIIKIYFSWIKKLYRGLGDISRKREIISNQKLHNSLFDIKVNLEKRLDNIRNFNVRTSIKQFDKQCINEDEYNMLLQSFDE